MMTEGSQKNIKKLFTAFISAILLLSLTFVLYAFVVRAEGPTEIYTIEDLDAVRNNLEGDYILMNNLDFNDPDSYADPQNMDTYTTGNGFVPIAQGRYKSAEPGMQTLGGDFSIQSEEEVDPFTGTFNGQGYTISNLFISAEGEFVGVPRGDDYWILVEAGLFGLLGPGAEISNIGLINIDVSCENCTTVAGLAANVEGASISNSYSSGRVSNDGGVGFASGFSTTAGGLVGWVWEEGEISNSYSVGRVIGEVESEGAYIGGLAGWIGAGSIENSYSRADVHSRDYAHARVGGLVGGAWEGMNISNSYSTGAVSGGQYLGGLIGKDDDAGTITNSFWDMDTSGRTTSDGGGGKTTEEMRDIATYTTGGAAWDITSVDVGDKNESFTWNMVDGVTYPFFSWARPDSPEIRTIEDLDAVRHDRAMSYTLMNDLDFDDPDSYDNPDNMGNYTTGVGFLPIGDWNSHFIGGFNGQGHTISNLFMDGTDFEEDPMYGSPPVGLFGCLETGAEISNIGLVDVNVTGHQHYTGALVGAIFDADIFNSYSTGNINATGWGIGGLIGGIWGGLVESSYSTADTAGKFCVGGLIGEISGEVNISNSYATGSASGDEDTVGGLVGGNWWGGNISKSYSTGAVSGTTDIGGLIGFDDGVGTISDSFWDMDTSGLTESDGGTGKTTAQMKSISTFNDTQTEGLDDPWDIVLVSLGETNTDYIWNIVNPEGTYPFLSGKEISIIEIYTIEDLYGIRNDLEGEYVLMNDLDFCDPDSYDEAMLSPGIEDFCEGEGATSGWDPIGFGGPGDYENSFIGIFDGDGHTIHNLFIDRDSEDNVGLFGHVGNDVDPTVIKNVCVNNVDVTGDRGAGALIGRVTGNSDTLIQNVCSTEGDVRGTGATGGLVGSHNSFRIRGGALSDPVIETSYSNINVFSLTGGGDKFGGIAGCSQKGSIVNSYAHGNVTATNAERVGGLAGCIEARGLVDSSYSTGVVDGDTLVGGLVGTIGFNLEPGVREGEVYDSFYDEDTSGQDDDDGRGTPKTTAEMKDISTFNDTQTEGLDEPWDIVLVSLGETNTDYIWNIVNPEGTYPFLSWEEPVEVLIYSISVPSELVFDKITWSLDPQVVEGVFSEPLVVTASEANDSGFVVTAAITEFLHDTEPAYFISYLNAELKTGELSSEPEQSDGVTLFLEDNYTAFEGDFAVSDPLAIIGADERPRDAGSWSTIPTLKLTVPAEQELGIYRATITFSFF